MRHLSFLEPRLWSFDVAAERLETRLILTRLPHHMRPEKRGRGIEKDEAYGLLLDERFEACREYAFRGC